MRTTKYSLIRKEERLPHTYHLSESEAMWSTIIGLDLLAFGAISLATMGAISGKTATAIYLGHESISQAVNLTMINEAIQKATK